VDFGHDRASSESASAAPNMTAAWRAVGMTYIRYANLCAANLREGLKEPFKSAALSREAVSFRSSVWKDGVQGASEQTSIGLENVAKK